MSRYGGFSPGRVRLIVDRFPQDVLNGRLERRTDEMVERGLVDELSRFKDELTKQKTTTGANK